MNKLLYNALGVCMVLGVITATILIAETICRLFGVA